MFNFAKFWTDYSERQTKAERANGELTNFSREVATLPNQISTLSIALPQNLTFPNIFNFVKYWTDYKEWDKLSKIPYKDW